MMWPPLLSIPPDAVSWLSNPVTFEAIEAIMSALTFTYGPGIRLGPMDPGKRGVWILRSLTAEVTPPPMAGRDHDIDGNPW